MVRRLVIAAGIAGAFALGVFVGLGRGVQAQTPPAHHVLEVRIYTAGEGKMDAVVKRFREPEVRLFDKYNMKAVFYSTIVSQPDRQNQFVYVLQHDSLEAAQANWAKFLADPEFKAGAQASDVGGRAVVKVEKFFVTPTDFSPLQ